MNQNQTITFNTAAKNQLAKLLATENITVRYDSGLKTACFDLQKRVLNLPVWKNISEDLHDMLVIHEVGHALDTPEEAWANAIKRISKKHSTEKFNQYQRAVKSFLNVLEDVRIDKRQKRRYPGSRRNYLAAYKELFERDFFKLNGRNINSLGLIDRINLYSKGGSILKKIDFSREEKVWLQRALETETFEQVELLTEELFAFSKKEAKTAQDHTDTDEMKDFSGDDQEDQEFDFDSFDDQEDGDTESEENESEGDESEDGESEGEEKSEADESDDEFTGNDKDGNNESSDDVIPESETDADDKDGNNESSDDVIPESETDAALEENKSAHAGDDIVYNYITIPQIHIDKLVDDFPKFLSDHDQYYSKGDGKNWLSLVQENLNRFKQSESNAISFMVKEFETKKAADLYSKIAVSKTGVIDTNKLHSYRYNEDIFRKLSVLPQGKNHGFCMFLDWSGSMTGNLRYTMQQLFSLVMFCKRVQIPFEVYLFKTHTPVGGIVATDHIKDHGVKIRNVLSSRMNTAQLNRAMLYMWAMIKSSNPIDSRNSTPLNEAIMAADQLVNRFKKHNKLQVVSTIFFTDGDADSSVNIYTNYLKKNLFVLLDPVTKRQYIMPDQWRGFTNTLVKVLKDRTGCTTLGFFLSPSLKSFRSISARYFPGKFDTSLLKKFWNDNGFIPVLSEGYDEYYVMEVNKKANDVLTIDTKTMTRAKIAREFLRYSEKKSVNRVLLSRFIDKISKEGHAQNA